MRARIFLGGSCVGEGLVSGAGVEAEGVEGEEVEEIRRAREERSSNLRRAIVVGDMVSLKGGVSEHRKRMRWTRSRERPWEVETLQ